MNGPLPPTIHKTIAENPENPREGGLKHEESARQAYMHVQNHVHHKVRLENHGFVISKDKPFLGASVDNVKTCECVSDCCRYWLNINARGNIDTVMRKKHFLVQKLEVCKLQDISS